MTQELKLEELNLHHFKGVRSFSLAANGESIRVFGDNATGKTTLFDAFIWLLFDKDSANRKDFSIKTIEDGEALRGMDHEVEGKFQVNGQPLSLKKVYKEKWTKKRNSPKKEFSGHTTDYYIDGVPSKKKEYEEQVSQIVDEDIFKLLTSPTYFNEQLHWTKKREILLEVCGDISDEDVINSKKSLAKLENVLNGKSIEKHKRMIAERRKEINNELERIPTRIDEVNRSKPDVSSLDEQEISDEILHVTSMISSKEEELMRVQNGVEITEKQKQLSSFESDLMAIKNKHQELNYGMLNEQQKEVYQLQSELDSLLRKSTDEKNAINRLRNAVEQKDSTLKSLREKWSRIDKETFEEHQTSCPTCGQDLPEEQIEDARNKFNLDKSNRLEDITAQGKSLTEDKEYDQKQIIFHQSTIEKIESDLQQAESKLDTSRIQLEDQKANVSKVENTGDYQEKMAEIKGVQESIQELRSSTKEQSESIKQAIAGFKDELHKLNQDKAQFSALERANKRIEQLKQEESELALEFERLEEELYLAEEFIRTKVSLLEEKINSKFKFARFNLFKTNINGGLEEQCETTYLDVPYSGGLNNAARINVGLDIISTLSEHYGFKAPIFVDNSEAVTKLIETDSQVISLVVSEADKQLRVETANLQEAI
jgi:DNA repair exonuclease SbcCD ATPase subunit